MKRRVGIALLVALLVGSVMATAPVALAAVSDAAFAALDARVRVLETMMGVPTPTPVPTATGTATAFPTASPTASPTPLPTATPAPVAMNRVSTFCYSQPVYMRRQVDPIVSPGVSPSAHVHDFYGRRDLSESMFATPRPAVAPNGDEAQRNDPGYTPISNSCTQYGDWAAYWFPVSFWNGAYIDVPFGYSVGSMYETYQAPVGVRVEPPPFGMAYVVGDAHATAQQPHVRFTCGPINGPGSALPQPCTTGAVTAELTFPDCFNGQSALGSVPAGINPAFFAYSVGGACPAGFPVRIAQLITRQQFVDPRLPFSSVTGPGLMTNPLNADGTLGLSFASGGSPTYHGDFLNTWSMIVLGSMVNSCLNGDSPCVDPPVDIDVP